MAGAAGIMPGLTLVAHADWSVSPKKRWMAYARLQENGKFLVSAPQPVGETKSFIRRMKAEAGKDGCTLAGFDYPIGLPASFAKKAGIRTFPDFLLHWGEGRWANFSNPAKSPEEISLERPFYPQSPGGSQRAFLTKGVGIAWPDLYRRCEQPHPDRRAACPLFWTLGGQQVGKAAISGWSEVLAPALQDSGSRLVIWPFAGKLSTLSQPGAIIAAETYPAEFYATLDISRGRWSKRCQADRQHRSSRLLRWAEGLDIALTCDLHEAIQAGFGNTASGEDQFDAVVGLFGMLGSLYNGVDEPDDDQIRSCEGWILGQKWNR